MGGLPPSVCNIDFVHLSLTFQIKSSLTKTIVLVLLRQFHHNIDQIKDFIYWSYLLYNLFLTGTINHAQKLCGAMHAHLYTEVTRFDTYQPSLRDSTHTRNVIYIYKVYKYNMRGGFE